MLQRINQAVVFVNLTKEWSNAAEVIASPVLEKPGCVGRYLPIGRIVNLSPFVDLAAQLVDNRVGIILLLFGRNPLVISEDDLGLLLFRSFFRAASLFGLWNRRDKRGNTPAVLDLLRRRSEAAYQGKFYVMLHPTLLESLGKRIRVFGRLSYKNDQIASVQIQQAEVLDVE